MVRGFVNTSIHTRLQVDCMRNVYPCYIHEATWYAHALHNNERSVPFRDASTRALSLKARTGPELYCARNKTQPSNVSNNTAM